MTTVRLQTLAIAGACLLFAGLACGPADNTRTSLHIECYSDAESCIESSGSHTTYIVESVGLPGSAGETSSFGLDLDGDDRVDNRLGGLMSALKTATQLDVQNLIDTLIADGTLMILIDVQAVDLQNASGVGGRVLAGTNASPTPCAGPGDTVCGNHLRGDATVDIDSQIAVDAVFAGEIVDGRFSSSSVPASFTLDLPEVLPRPVAVKLIGARADNAVSANSLDGIAGAAISMDEIDGTIFPALSDLVAVDCTGTGPACCTAGSLGESIVDLFDTNGDCAVTVAEMKSNLVVGAVIAPDLDLLDSDGSFAPGSDGVAESMSLGARFRAVPASFPHP
ncbi:MAG: hypothetical protein MJE77_13375 [Proteobacteria bacterium]|nr:hypothetical protein [Pseudomonadota bacterium]